MTRLITSASRLYEKKKQKHAYKCFVVIVKKGLIVLQLLASPSVVEEDKAKEMIVRILKSALQHFTDSKGVQSEVNATTHSQETDKHAEKKNG